MRKSLIKILALTLVLLTTIFTATACKEERHVHNYIRTVVSPTCTEKGYTQNTCTCGGKFKDAYTNPLGHNYVKTVVLPTCTEEGYTLYVCACGENYKNTYTYPTGHKLVNGECSVCKHIHTFKSGWSYNEGYHYKNSTCGHNLVKDKDVHIFSNNTCVTCGYKKSGSANTTSGIRPEVKAAIDSYEAFYDEYCDFMLVYKEKGSPISMLEEYLDLIEQATVVNYNFQKINEQTLNEDEAFYCAEVSLRVSKKLLDLAK